MKTKMQILERFPRYISQKFKNWFLKFYDAGKTPVEDQTTNRVVMTIGTNRGETSQIVTTNNAAKFISLHQKPNHYTIENIDALSWRYNDK